MHYFEHHWHSGPLHILLHIHTISSITTSGSDILSNNSCPSSIIHPCPSLLLLSFFGSNLFSIPFLAHLSRRLIGELIVYPWSGVRRRPSVVRPSYVVRRPSFTMLKHLLLRNRLADQSQILCGASLGRGNKILFAASGSHDQDGRHAHIW